MGNVCIGKVLYTKCFRKSFFVTICPTNVHVHLSGKCTGRIGKCSGQMYITAWHVTSHRNTSRHVCSTSRHDTSRHIAIRHVTCALCHVMTRHVTSQHVTSRVLYVTSRFATHHVKLRHVTSAPNQINSWHVKRTKWPTIVTNQLDQMNRAVVL